MRRQEKHQRWAPAAVPLIGAAIVMELGWLMVGAASPRLTESTGFTDALLQALPPIWAWADALRHTDSPETASKLIFVGGLSVAVFGYVAAVATSLHSQARSLNVVIAAGLVLFGASLMVTPGLLSTDLVTYALYGRLAAVYGLNPYLAAPQSIANDPLVAWSGPAWIATTTVYGPLWSGISAALADLTAQASPLSQTLPYRLIGLAAHATNAYLVWRLVPYVAAGMTSRSVAVLLYAWNPLALFELVASGHNDALMLTLVLAGLLLAFGGRHALVGTAVVWAAALVKWVPAVVVLYLTSASLSAVSSLSVRAKRLARLGAILAALTILSFLPWTDTRTVSELPASLAAGRERYVNALIDLPTAWIASHFIDRAGTDVATSQATVRAWTFGFARGALVLWVLLELLRLSRIGAALSEVLQASARTLLIALLMAASQVLAWYFTWPLALAAPLGFSSKFTRLVVAYSVLYLPIFYAIHEDMFSTQVVPAILVIYVFLPILVSLVGRSRPARLLMAEDQAAA